MSVDAPVQNAIRRFADRVALIEGERCWSFADLGRQVSSAASALSQRLRPGDRVALFMANRAEYLILQMALERAGLIRVPLNARYTAFEVANLLDDCEATALFFDSATAERVGGLERSRRWLCQVDGNVGEGGPGWHALLAAEPGIAHAVDDLDVLCSINYTSGSSGKPKGVMLTHRNWRSVYKNMLIDRDIRSDDILTHIGPLSHASGSYFIPFFLRGASSLVVEGGALDRLLPAIERYRATALTCVPTVLTRILNSPDIGRFDLSSLRWIGYGAEAIQRNTLERAIARWGPILTQNYGLTEAMMTCTRLDPQEHLLPANGLGPPQIRHGSIGRPYSFVEIVLRDSEGRRVPTGEVGEITIRAEHVMQGYWRRPEETQAVLHDGWLWSGDLARMDEAGFIYLIGRSKEMLISGGFNIYPAELEACLSSCPGVQEAAVIGMPDADFGEIAVAFVSAEPGAPLSDWQCVAYCKPRLGLRTPKRWVFLPVLPRTGNGKIDKASLKAMLLTGDRR